MGICEQNSIAPSSCSHAAPVGQELHPRNVPSCCVANIQVLFLQMPADSNRLWCYPCTWMLVWGECVCTLLCECWQAASLGIDLQPFRLGPKGQAVSSVSHWEGHYSRTDLRSQIPLKDREEKGEVMAVGETVREERQKEGKIVI